MFEIRLAVTAEEKDAVCRARYTVYVEEMGWCADAADHRAHSLIEPEDENSWLIYAAAEDGTILGSYRMTRGSDGFSERQIEMYGLEPFLAELPPKALAVGERLAVSVNGPSGDLTFPPFVGMENIPGWDGVHVVFGACEPHQLSLHLQYQRPYAPRNISRRGMDYLVPLLAFPHGPEALTGLGHGPGVPSCIEQVLWTTGAIESPLLSRPETYWTEVQRCIATTGTQSGPLFDGLTEDEVRRCVAMTHILRCAAGDRVIRQGGRGRNVFMVLEGALTVSHDDQPVGLLGPGDVFGETAFLLHRPEGLDVDVVNDHTRLLSFNERHLNAVLEADAARAARVYANMARTLSARLTRTA